MVSHGLNPLGLRFKVAVRPKRSTNRNVKQIITIKCTRTVVFQLLRPLDVVKLAKRELIRWSIITVIFQHAQFIYNLDSRGFWRINESLAKVCCKQSVSKRWVSKLHVSVCRPLRPNCNLKSSFETKLL